MTSKLELCSGRAWTCGCGSPPASLPKRIVNVFSIIAYTCTTSYKRRIPSCVSSLERTHEAPKKRPLLAGFSSQSTSCANITSTPCFSSPLIRSIVCSANFLSLCMQQT